MSHIHTQRINRDIQNDAAHRVGVHEDIIGIVTPHAGERDDDCIGLGRQPHKIWSIPPLQLVLCAHPLVDLRRPFATQAHSAINGPTIPVMSFCIHTSLARCCWKISL